MPLSAASGIFNSLIARLPRQDQPGFLDRLEPVHLVFGDVLWEAGDSASHVYFPIQGFVSLIARLGNSELLEMGLVGNEGVVGATLALGVDAAPLRAVVQGAGTALRMPAAQWRRELADNAALCALVHRYLYVSIAQLSRSAACIRFHAIEPRLARWLLMTHDRAHAEEFQMTHEFLADMLGVRRSGVTVAAGKLQRRRLIRYSRGTITVINRKGLEECACDCYSGLQSDYVNGFRGPGPPAAD